MRLLKSKTLVISLFNRSKAISWILSTFSNESTSIDSLAPSIHWKTPRDAENYVRSIAVTTKLRLSGMLRNSTIGGTRYFQADHNQRKSDISFFYSLGHWESKSCNFGAFTRKASTPTFWTRNIRFNCQFFFLKSKDPV